MLKVSAHVVAAKRQHGKWITPDQTCRTTLGSRGFRAHGCSKINPLVPVSGTDYQRHRVAASPPENEGVNRYTLRVVPVLIQGRALRRRHRKTSVRVGCFAPGLAIGRRPILTLPVH